MPTALYEMYEKAPQVIILTSPEEVEEKKLRGKAAEYIQETGALFVNGLYEAIDRTIADVEPLYAGQGDPEVLRKSMITSARKAMAFLSRGCSCPRSSHDALIRRRRWSRHPCPLCPGPQREVELKVPESGNALGGAPKLWEKSAALPNQRAYSPGI
jgi:hypothetical protein